MKELAERSHGKRPKRLGRQKSIPEVRRMWKAMERVGVWAARFNGILKSDRIKRTGSIACWEVTRDFPESRVNGKHIVISGERDSGRGSKTGFLFLEG